MNDTVYKRAATFVVDEVKAGRPFEDVEAALLMCAAQCAFRARRVDAALFVEDVTNAWEAQCKAELAAAAG